MGQALRGQSLRAKVSLYTMYKDNMDRADHAVTCAGISVQYCYEAITITQ